MEDNFNKELNEQIEKLNVGSDTPMQNFSTPTQPQNANPSVTGETSEKKDGKQIIYIYKGAECTTNHDVIPSFKLNLAINKKLNTGENYCLSL